MSKVDAQRAMREARYAARNAAGAPTRRAAAAAAEGTAKTPPAAAPAVKPAKATKPLKATKATPTAAAAAPQGEPCGHKSMNGRACTREAGHSEKSHRYG